MTSARGPRASTWKWRAEKLSRRVASEICRHLYRDLDRETSRSILVAGTARSGSTWIAEVIASQVPCRVMFEPFHRGKIRELVGLHYFQFHRPSDIDIALERFCQRLFSGEIRHRWIDREVRCLVPHYRLIKEIRANLMLRWIHDRFPSVRMLLLLRHPCAVVASRMSLGWATDTDLDSFAGQPALLDEIPAATLALIRREGSDAAKHAAIWCINYLVPLRQFAPAQIPIVYYEHLVTDPGRQLPALFAAAGVPYEDSVFQRLRVPSTTAVGHSAVTRGESSIDAWQRSLGYRDVDEILAVLDAFGLSGLYSADPLPLTTDPWSALIRRTSSPH